jgi:hypothetical protein
MPEEMKLRVAGKQVPFSAQERGRQVASHRVIDFGTEPSAKEADVVDFAEFSDAADRFADDGEGVRMLSTRAL